MALSPYASIASGALDTRYRDIRTPVLSVTSDADGDALGMVDSVALRIVNWLSDSLRGFASDQRVIHCPDIAGDARSTDLHRRSYDSMPLLA